MVDPTQVIVGVFMILVGVLAAINHPIIDGLNRWMKSLGSGQKPSNVEMNEISVLVSRIAGVGIAIIGIVLVVDTVI